ncbi:hypothetical protein [Microbulbifer aggregans]|uniref:hypothetical protein n=1 Tax=Microbulbifer aggregans TaxID=1769779 RepID=UPI001CFDE4FC|nr:hypothetical protein [Microbulbifer aggregans]
MLLLFFDFGRFGANQAQKVKSAASLRANIANMLAPANGLARAFWVMRIKLHGKQSGWLNKGAPTSQLKGAPTNRGESKQGLNN